MFAARRDIYIDGRDTASLPRDVSGPREVQQRHDALRHCSVAELLLCGADRQEGALHCKFSQHQYLQ